MWGSTSQPIPPVPSSPRTHGVVPLGGYMGQNVPETNLVAWEGSLGSPTRVGSTHHVHTGSGGSPPVVATPIQH